MNSETTLRRLTTELPARVKAARLANLECVRLTIPEARALHAVLARELALLDETAIRSRRQGWESGGPSPNRRSNCA